MTEKLPIILSQQTQRPTIQDNNLSQQTQTPEISSNYNNLNKNGDSKIETIAKIVYPDAIPCSSYFEMAFNFTDLGFKIPKTTLFELQSLLEVYINEIAGFGQKIMLRIDAYLGSDGSITILDINSDFFNGWGTALAINRAFNISPGIPKDFNFPKFWDCSENPDYLPELKTSVKELNLLGFDVQELTKKTIDYSKNNVYNYCRFQADSSKDNKMNLAYLKTMSLTKSKNVSIPNIYSVENTPFDKIPKRFILKSIDKSKTGLRNSVIFGNDCLGKKPMGQYNRGIYLAQQWIDPYFVDGGRPTQLVFLTCGSAVATGYAQIAKPGRKSINDNSIIAPILII